MKREFQILLVLVIVFAWSCNKKEKPNVSTWTVNGETFTATAASSIGKAIVILSNENFDNGFKFVFYLPGYFPTEGQWPIGDTSSFNAQNPNYVYVGFSYHGIGYTLSEYQIGALQAVVYEDGKASYTLAPTWFTNSLNYSDSVLISGTFNEP
jgi:hypothetical protein